MVALYVALVALTVVALVLFVKAFVARGEEDNRNALRVATEAQRATSAAHADWDFNRRGDDI